MYIISILLSYQVVVLTQEIMSPIRSNTLTVPVSQIHIERKISMTIADDLSALSEHALLIAFVINPVLGPELQCFLKVKEDLSIEFSGCQK